MSNLETRIDHLAIIPRNQHNVSRKSISEAALKVLYRLDKCGHRACLVGGGVRDLLLGKRPKDFDVATDATPEQIRELFRNSRIIGRRFRLVHIRFGREVIEVATFRGHSTESPRTELSTEGRILRDNTFGEIEDDAIRRDFTANALYYDIRDFSVLDYANGLADIESRRLRMIGDATTRYQEDPVRMLRAIRFAAKLEFEIEENAAKAIFECGDRLTAVPAARLFDEIVKLFHSGSACRVFELLRHYRLLQYLMPTLDTWLQDKPEESMLDFIDQALVNTDIRVNSQQHVSPAFIFAVLLWPLVHKRASKLQSEKTKPIAALTQAGGEVMTRQLKYISIPRRYSQMSRDIWSAQPRFQRTNGKYPMRLLGYPNFRAAFDFMCIQSMVGLAPKKICAWWADFQQQHKPAKSHSRQPPAARTQKHKRGRHAS
ncbi:MAG: polynucleotide adenylyltransferase PcnB [Gammaproteobacteria bacterium]|nr:polynucleotide adenylyltransferase PcnB [Gammaproteobacteria bacterium]